MQQKRHCQSTSRLYCDSFRELPLGGPTEPPRVLSDRSHILDALGQLRRELNL